MTEKSANQILRRCGWRADMEPPQKRALQPCDPGLVAEALELRNQGFGAHVVSHHTGIPKYTVKNIFRRAGFRRQGCSTEQRLPRQVNEDVTYLNPNSGMAWCLGLIYGDGHLAGETKQVTMLGEDEDVVRKFAALHGTLKVLDNRYWRATWCCARLYRELESYGLCPNKSAVLEFPDLDAAALPHFVRGLLDSDGSFHRAGDGQLAHLLRFQYSCICGPFMQALRDVLVQYAGLSPSIKVRSRFQKDTPNEVFTLKYSHEDAVQLGRWLYADSTPETRGDRKHAIWDIAKEYVIGGRSERRALPRKVKAASGSQRDRVRRSPADKQALNSNSTDPETHARFD